MKTKLSLNDRMKKYEKLTKQIISKNGHYVIRLDGRGFSKYTKKFMAPFDDLFINAMNYASVKLAESVQGAKLAYTQSDEISLYFTDTDSEETQLFFGGNVEKINSVCATIVANAFNEFLIHDIALYSYDKAVDIFNFKFAEFDCRLIKLPTVIEVHNCFLWRQNDNKRNSIAQVAQSHFSHKQLYKKSTKDMLEMLKDVDDWNEYPEDQKMGRIIHKVTYEKNDTLRSKWEAFPAKDIKNANYLNVDLNG